MRRKYSLIILVTISYFFICSVAWAELSTAKPEELGLSPERLNLISATLKAHIEKGVIPGAVVLVVRNGKIAYFENFGMRDLSKSLPMEKDTIFQVYSMSKPITSVAAMMLHEQGRFFLGDPVSKYIPEFKEMKVGEEGSNLARKQITIHDLLRQTSGLTYGFMGNSKIHQMYKAAGLSSPDQTLAEMITKLSEIPLVAEPGTKWVYGRSTDVLGRVIEIASGMPLDKYLENRIFKPLKMADTGFYVEPEKIDRVAKPGPNAKWPSHYPTTPPKNLLGGQGLVSTAHDYMRFMQMLMNKGQLDGVRLLSPSTVDYMTTDHLGSSIPKKGPGYFIGEGAGFGLGFAVRESNGVATVPGYVGDYTWMGAGGTNFFISPQEKLSAIFMTEANDMGLMAYYARLIRTLEMASIVD
jgi:CubicO group peptidase (beta-lactamase class C family)